MQTSFNPQAPAFYSKQTPVVFMAPLEGICPDFQFGSCKMADHNRTEDGKMRLHVCQPCVQFREIFVDHCCAGGHPSHPNLCNKKKIGAVSCPFQVVQTTAPPPVTSNITATPSNIAAGHHTPSFLCFCRDCSIFFTKIQKEMDQCGVMCDLAETRDNYHHPPPPYLLCVCEACHHNFSAPCYSDLCPECDNYFGGLEGLNRYNRQLEREQAQCGWESDDSYGNDSDCHESDYYW